MRHRADLNQFEIVQGLRDTGHSVQILSQVGDNCPDLLVGRGGQNFLFEAKSERGKVSEGQKEWHVKWKGQVAVIKTVDEAIEIVNKEIRGRR